MMKKQYIKRSRRIFGIFALTALLSSLVLGGCGKEEQSKGSDSVDSGAYLLTVDGYGVTEEEFMLFLRDQKAATVNYFWVNYKAESDDKFWTSEFDGVTPLDYAKEKALAAVVQAKEEFILASERGILEYKDYGGMMEEMEEENAQRASKKDSGDAFYGLSEFTPFTYYQYLNGNIRSELEHSQEELVEPTKKQLEEVYEANKENLTLGTVYKYTVIYEDGRTEEVTQNTRDIAKEDTTTEDLIYNYFDYMKPGDSIQGYLYREDKVNIVLKSVESLGYMPFEEAEDSLRVFFARSEVSRLIAERVEAAEIVFDQDRYDAITMS